ncbi:hypothetical protein ABDF71_22895 [Ochrobactrum sp. WV_118_8]|uniref:hypothetical protein n=1 Tax=Brucella anthropi TaxID=529 RepID=UPI0021588006|nr:hypothetical protein [Brucella anthropi]MCR8490943.1 hypothetical protein [Brucella anthropi]
MSEYSEADHLGRVGEDFFQGLANKARLLVGKIDPDRVGKDRIIEFKLPERDECLSFDKQLPPLKCAVQIKAVKQTTERVTLSLSVAARLIADSHPVFVAMLKIGPEDDVVEMRLLHLLNDPLAKILKRLREEYAKGSTKLNEHSISFSFGEGEQVDLAPTALVEVLQRAIGPDMDRYAAEKTRQRKLLGYKQNFFSVNTTFDAKDMGEIVDGMLGLKTLNVQSIKAYEERFEIKLEDKEIFPYDFTEGTMTITASSSEKAEVVVRSMENEDFAKFVCEVISPNIPNLPAEYFKVRLKTNMVDFIFGGGSLKFSITNGLNEYSIATVFSWLNILRVLKIFKEGKFALWVVRDGEEHRVGHVDEPMLIDDQGWLSLLPLVERFGYLRNEAAVPDKEISIKDIYDAKDAIDAAYYSFRDPGALSPLTFKTDAPSVELPRTMSCLLTNLLVVGDERYAYATKFEMTWSKSSLGFNWTGKNGQAVAIEPIFDQASISSFSKRMGRISGCQLAIVPDLTMNVDAPVDTVEMDKSVEKYCEPQVRDQSSSDA